jgi:hypothetical protein
MLKFDPEAKEFHRLSNTALKTENILERYDLQETIVACWDLFRNEIGLPTSFLVGEEINPHSSVQNSIDLLAFNPDDSGLVVIELKRNKHKLQLLQALSYAAMVSTWDAESLISKISHKCNPDPEELIDLINGAEWNNNISVVLVAESFDPEVIITANWLSETYSVDVSAFALDLHKSGEDTFMTVEQRYPLKDLADVYETRRKVRNQEVTGRATSWDEVLPKLEYSFAKRGLDLCSKITPGDPGRRRFGVRSNYDGFKWININFRQKYINVYISGDFDDAEESLRSKFQEEIQIGTWKNGYSFNLATESQFEDLIKWLNLE